MQALEIDVLLLFNLTDHAAAPWLAMGFDVLSVDTQHPEFLSVTRTAEEGVGDHWRTNEPVTSRFVEYWKPKIVIAFPPCTDLAVSGAKHFAKKLKANPNVQKDAVELAKVASLFGVPYAIENPVSVLATQWRKPDYYFHPYEYGDYLMPSESEHPEYPEYIAAYDAYPKKTCLWTGNGFIMPPKMPVEPVEGYSKQHLKLGGKSMKTKNIRSATPRGFSWAVALHNAPLMRS